MEGYGDSNEEMANDPGKKKKKPRHWEDNQSSDKMLEKGQAINNFKCIARETKDKILDLFITQMYSELNLHKFSKFHKRMNRRNNFTSNIL